LASYPSDHIVVALVKQFDVDHVRAEMDYLDFAGKLLSVGALVRVTESDAVRSA